MTDEIISQPASIHGRVTTQSFSFSPAVNLDYKVSFILLALQNCTLHHLIFSSQIFGRNTSNHSNTFQTLTAALKQQWSLMKIWHKCHHLLSHSTLHSFTQALWRARITSSASTQPHGWKHGIFIRKMVCIMDKQCFITHNQEASANKLFQKTNCALQHKKVLLPRSKIH